MFKRKLKFSWFDVFDDIFFIIISFVSIFPIYLILANAFSSEADIQLLGYAVFPVHFSVDAFKYIFKEPSQLIDSTIATLIHSVGKSFFSTLVSVMLGYALYRKEFILKRFFNVLLLITMFFSAGLIPSYIINTQVYHLENTWLIYLLPAVSGFNVFLYRSFFGQVPQSLIESAEIDGASHMRILFSISLPLTSTLIATNFFLGMRGLWSDFTTSLYYISEPKMYTLEYYIQLISKDAALMQQNLIALGLKATEIPTETMKFATVFFTLIPLLVIFPFFQKYFKKGLNVGAVKG